MKRFCKARKSGFTLVELLIVIMIIAILAGMMMLATGSATDSANATKIINDLRAAKSAALLIYMDEGQDWTSWATDGEKGDTDAVVTSFDHYMDRPMFGSGGQYKLNFKENVTIKTAASNTGGGGTQNGSTRTLIGFTLKSAPSQTLKEKLENSAARAGLFSDGGDPWKATDTTNKVWMVLY